MRKIFNRNTHLCVNLKTCLLGDPIMQRTKRYHGVLTRDIVTTDYVFDDEHFTFTETGDRRRVHRNECIYSGRCVNVNRRIDGSLLLSFNRPRFNRELTFRDFCRMAAKELVVVSGLVGE
jgi:hypothetical protein